MLKRILVPVDGSDLAERILFEVRGLLAAEGTQVVLLSVLPTRTPLSREIDPRGWLDALQRRLAGEGLRVDVELSIGDPAEEILRSADRVDPSLIAMSTHGRSGIGRWARGSVAERVLRRSRHPLLLANPRSLGTTIEGGARPFRRILLPLDGSELSASIVPLVVKVARVYESEVFAIHAIPPMPSKTPAPYVEPHPSVEEVERFLEPMLVPFEEAGIRNRLMVRYERPAEAILEAARSEHMDLVAMTTHGSSGVSRWVFGSVAEKVLREGSWPLLVRRTAGFEEAWGAAGGRTLPAD